MVVTVFSAAKYLVKKSGYSLTHLNIQRILYLSHMFYMGLHEGEPLLNRPFEAWDYGPIIPELYDLLKIYGAEPVGNIFRKYTDIPEGEEKYTLDKAYDSLSCKTGAELVAYTHRRGGAWDKTYSPGKATPMPNNTIYAESRL